MLFSVPHAATFFSLLSSALSFTPCPLLCPAYPPFTLDISDKTITSALDALIREFNTLVATSTGSHGDVSPNTTFSIALFSVDAGNAQDQPFFWQYHHTAPALNQSAAGSRVANEDSIYHIGGVTEVFTVWSLLLSAGDQVLNDPVTKYLPELVHNPRILMTIDHVSWDDVTVGELASHMSGIPRDYCSTDVTLQASPTEAGLPSQQDDPRPCCDSGKKCGSGEFIRYLANESPIAPPGVTPSYSNMAFQLLGYIVERIAGKPFDEYLEQDILDVLGMTQITIFAPFNSSRKGSSPGGSYFNTSMVDVYTVLSNRGVNEGLYSSYLGLVPDFGVGFAILSADTVTPADLNAHADIIGDVVLEALMVSAIEQAPLISSITVAYDELPGLYINEFISNGTDFRATLAGLLGIADPANLSIRLYPTQLVDHDTSAADNGTPTCVSWINLDKIRYGGRALDEFVFDLDGSGRAVGVQIPALEVKLLRETDKQA
ncbi:beta-lactamase/transpeptidase-like protein [Aspergillus venezuelensis]